VVHTGEVQGSIPCASTIALYIQAALSDSAADFWKRSIINAVTGMIRAIVTT